MSRPFLRKFVTIAGFIFAAIPIAQPSHAQLGIRIQTSVNYENEGWTVCHANNQMATTAIAYFDVYPAKAAQRLSSWGPVSVRRFPNGHGTVGPITMQVGGSYSVAEWRDSTPGISCALALPRLRYGQIPSATRHSQQRPAYGYANYGNAPSPSYGSGYYGCQRVWDGSAWVSTCY